ncbi:carbohydrate ABC transporter permease [Schaalia suimastitidis]|uniref:carbohydrate ABC transporter permease n=1 Tax=Schaalia suimastitidis TaxID=121163 RepID=UPI000418A3F0|nr:sugar ABC transporter permease [Schaalia suimastitidis]
MSTLTRAGTMPRPKKSQHKDRRYATFFLLPAAIGLITFYILPAMRGFYYSFTDYPVLQPAQWVGADNYTRLASDPLFWNAMWVTAYYVILNIGFQTIIAIVLAVLLQRLTQSTLIRGMALLPYFVANVVIALLWYFMMDYQMGIVNVGLDAIGLNRVAFFGESAWAIPTIAFINVWRHMGYTALLVFAGLQTINRSVYEAADIDGAGEGRKFFSITLPLLRPVLAMVLVVTVTGSFQIFDTVAITTQGGPINATRVVYYYIYDVAFGQLDFGYASAMAMVLFVLLVGISFIQLKLMRAGESDES